MQYPNTLSSLYAPNYLLSDLFEFSIIKTDASLSAEKALQVNIDGININIIPSYEIVDLEEYNTDYRVNGANYYYDNVGYSAFANLEAIAMYIRKYCFIGNILSTKIFNSLIPKYIVVFQTVLVDKKPSLGLYIGKRKDL